MPTQSKGGQEWKKESYDTWHLMGDAFGIYKQTEQGWWMYITYHIPNLDVEINNHYTLVHNWFLQCRSIQA
jgi:hypothetical protein